MRITDKASFSNKSPARNKSNRRSSFAHAGLGQQRKRRILFGGGADTTAFDPLDLSATTTLELWLDASQITGMSDGDDLTTGSGNSEWDDQSGNSVAVHAGVLVGLSPSYQTNIINGLPAILFDQTISGGMTHVEQVSCNLSGNTFKAADYTVFIVIQPVDVTNALAGGGQHIFGVYKDDDWTETDDRIGNRLSMGILQSDSKFIVQGNQPVNDRVSGPSALEDGIPYILTAAYDYSATTMWNWVDNDSGVSFVTTQIQTNWDGETVGYGAGTVTIGGGIGTRGSTKNDYDGYIAEIIVYSTLLSERELNFVKHYLADKYNISVPTKSRY